jgi:hypothetical protein
MLQMREIKPRDSVIRRIMDPSGTLPPVSLRPIVSQSTPVETIEYDLFAESNRAGEAAITVYSGRKELYFDDVRRDVSLVAQKGIGLAAYILAAEEAHAQGYDFRNGFGLSDEAKRIWDIFIDRGVATVVEPLEASMGYGSSGEEIFTGYNGYVKIGVDLHAQIRSDI